MEVSSTISTMVLIFILASIVLGYLYKANIGIFAIPLCFIGAYMYGLSAKNVENLWGLQLFFVLVSITFFYGFAISNGTLSNLAMKAMYSARHYPWSVPIVLYIVVVVFVGIGPGHYAGFAFMSPLVLYIADKINMNKILAAIIIYSGSCAGGFNPFTLGGRVTNSLILEQGYTAEVASSFQLSLGLNMFIAHTLIFVFGYFLLKGYKNDNIRDIEPPERLNAVQIRTIFIVALVFLATTVPSVWLAITPDNAALAKFTKMMNPTFLCLLGVALAIIFKLGSEKEAFKNIPWDLIFMISALGMLVALGKEAGAMKIISDFLNANTKDGGDTIFYLLALMSSAMSTFASSMGVVMPTFFPLVPGLEITNYALAFSVIGVFATFTGYSSFSTGGALVLAGTKDEEERRYLFIRLLILPFVLVAFGMVLLFIGILR